MTSIIKIIIIITIITIQSFIWVGLIHGAITDGKNQPESVHWGKDGGLIICQSVKVPKCQGAKREINSGGGRNKTELGNKICGHWTTLLLPFCFCQTIPHDKVNWIWWCMSMKLGIISNPALKHEGIPELKSWSESLTWRVFFSIAELPYPPGMKVLMCETAKM